MRYFSRTIKYMFRNFLPLALVAVVPAVIVGLLMSPTDPAAFFVTYFRWQGYEGGDTTLFRNYLFDWRVFGHVYPILLIFLSLVAGCGISISAIEKHMRIGVMSVRQPFKLLNSSAVPVIVSLIFLILLYALIRFIYFGLAILINYMTGSFYLAAVLLALTFVGLITLLLFLASPILLWTPCMMIYGYKFGDAASTGFRMAGKRAFSLFMAQVIPISFFFAVRIIIELIFVAGGWAVPQAAVWTVDIIACLLLIMYYCSFVAVAYFDLAGIERKDIAVRLY